MDASETKRELLLYKIEKMGKLFGEHLNLRMNTQGITRAILAARLKVSYVSVELWLKGINLPDSRRVYQITCALNLPSLYSKGLVDTWTVCHRLRSIMPYLTLAMKEKDFDLFDNTCSLHLALSSGFDPSSDSNPLFPSKAQLNEINLFAPALEFYMNSRELNQNNLASKVAVTAATVYYWRTNQRFPDSAMVYLVGKGLKLQREEKIHLTNCWQVTNYIKAVIPCFEEVRKNNDESMVESIQEMCIQTANQLSIPHPLASYVKNWHSKVA